MLEQEIQEHLNNVDSHFPEEEISRRRNTHTNISENYQNEMIPWETYGEGYSYDPYEPVPSYETSQLMHGHRVSGELIDSSMIEESAYHPSSLAATNVNSDTGRSNHSHLFSNGGISGGQLNSAEERVTDLRKSTSSKKSLKITVLRFLSARQHFALAFCRDISLVPCIFGFIYSWKNTFFSKDCLSSDPIYGTPLKDTLADTHYFEQFLTGIWCIVSGYMSYSVLDNLMLRWIVTYLASATIVRMLTLSAVMITIEIYVINTFSSVSNTYSLHIWIFISCCLTAMFIVQSFVTLNLDLKGKKRARFFDMYNIAVFAVVPVGVASFITMIGLLRSLLILRLDLEEKVHMGRNM